MAGSHPLIPLFWCALLILSIMSMACSGIVQGNQEGLLEETAATKSTIEHDDSIFLSSDSLPIFQAEPQNAYVVKNRPALLQCKAGNALRVYFKCNGAKNVESTQSEFVHPQTGVRIVEAEINITRDMVEEFFGNEKFKCECHAWSGRGSIKSQPAIVDVAYLKKQFDVNPESTRVEIGHQMELRCVAPMGMPPPRIYWLRGGQPLQSDTTMLVSSEGQLLISQARPQDTGNYTCVAENIAAKRLSNPAQITVYVNGGWSQWSPWTDCKCPGSTLPLGKMSTRTCTNPPPSNGGLACVGSAVRKTKDCQQCPQEPARWSTWSEWTKCNSDCIKIRKRQCIPGNGVGRKNCNGRDTQTAPCTAEICKSSELTRVKEANLESTQYDIILYIGLMVAILIVLLLSYFLVRVYRKKDQHQSLYNMASNEYHPEYFPDHDKKSLSLQPDLTQTVPPCYEYPSYTTPSTAMVTRSVSEHHYDVPHLASGSDIQMSPATSSTLESSSGKRSQLSGFTNNSDSTYEVAADSVTLPMSTLPAAYAVTPATNGNYTSATVGHSGAFLNLPESGVSLTVPEGAISRSRKQEIFLSILNEDCFRPKLADNLTQLSPVVSCGPNISLNKAVILKVPHCAELSKHNWSVSVLQSDCSDSQWQTAVTLGHETINTSVFCQLDEDVAFLVTDCLSRFVLVGQSTTGAAIKKLKLAIFAPKLCLQTSIDYSVRVYVLEDTDSSMETVFGQEKRLGGYLLDNPKTITFQDGGNNLCLSLENISEGWKAKSSSNYQEIPFRHLWQSNSNSLHCSFNLEAYEMNRNLNFKIKVNQKGFDHIQYFDVVCREDMDIPNMKNNSIKLYHNELVPKITIQSETSRSSDSKKSVEFAHSPKSSKSFKFSAADDQTPKVAKNLIVTDRGVSTCDDFTFRLSKQIRKQLCQVLDTPTSRANDWRLLAHALQVDRYINFFATKPSPTDCILDLWEARNRTSNALSELRQIFNDMERYDAVNILDSCLGPNWL
ncbi:netrin receptor UNC5B [Harmonia axyridis]|uniref:netrin receptor UNC5B n=1 Tax=Harmonia axyridis TaxID=115357 RepID=UPI001E276E60|nr:netrin receptor UNC5B [Harmonia axyridis]XP_045470246.1 netrin receptor UNC5B [Harmonia axyridis]